MAKRVDSDSGEAVEELTVDDAVNTAIRARLEPDETDVCHVSDDDVITWL